MRTLLIPLLALLAACNPGPSDDKDAAVDTDVQDDTPEDSEDTPDDSEDTPDDSEDTPDDTEEPAVDADQDLSPASVDCDDGDAAIHPGAAELCDGVDQDCDNVVDNGLEMVEGFRDADGDTWGDVTDRVTACALPAGYVPRGSDCEDGDAAISPDAVEACDDIDGNCDGNVDEGFTRVALFPDGDGDGFGDAGVIEWTTCQQPAGYVSNRDDCDDASGSRYPGASEVCDGVDQDCDNVADDGLAVVQSWVDADGDTWGDGEAGFSGCMVPVGNVQRSGDCDDSRGDVSPLGQETCDGADEDCNGTADDHIEFFWWFPDQDADGHGVPEGEVWACAPMAGRALYNDDCDDHDARRFSGNAEVCDGVDSNCDETTPFEEGDYSGDGLPDCAPASCTGTGMSWGALPPDDGGTVYTGCYAGGTCDASRGDTACTAALPILCVAPNGAPNPGIVGNWFGADSDITPPIAGCQLPEVDSADKVCAAHFGEGWRAAEFHDGGGWNMYTFGTWTTDSQLWVQINDSPANCSNNAVSLTDVDGDRSHVPWDCDDSDAAVFPGAAEVCDGVDTNCDGVLPMEEQDLTGDGLPDCQVGTCSGTGMSWKQTAYDDEAGAVYVSCHGAEPCNAYVGDAACATPRPLLCLHRSGAADPGLNWAWFPGEAAITGPVSGCQLTSLATADDLCASWFGPDWRMAEFHDAGGWSIGARGDFDTTERMWVQISDQPADCWE